jgi:hypothetical protein
LFISLFISTVLSRRGDPAAEHLEDLTKVGQGSEVIPNPVEATSDDQSSQEDGNSEEISGEAAM